MREFFNNEKSVRIMAPTGVDASNTGGSTIHHELAITADRNLSYKKLEAERCRRMQVDFKDTKLIIINEYNMIGRKMLTNINLRLRDIFLTSEPFGNVSIVLVGDMRQLSHVFDMPLYVEGGGELQLTYYAANHNCQRLRRLGLPVARIPSKNNYATAKEANSDEAKSHNKIDIVFWGGMRAYSVTTYLLLGNNGSQELGVDS
ncbi:hypothetical protein C5167_038197 [Papaver somniferum]|uniref:ATP-dependent DNA helicase n=1 Tax=Papaver somniferum TaxID=3469 RepID=A0A4Y7ICV0_PAPSO|nr:hypothetical protein C5167_038197 [Papaver somniferum]